MARYIKVNPLVADYLNLRNDRNTVKDGNYLLWQADMLRFGPLTELVTCDCVDCVEDVSFFVCSSAWSPTWGFAVG